MKTKKNKNELQQKKTKYWTKSRCPPSMNYLVSVSFYLKFKMADKIKMASATTLFLFGSDTVIFQPISYCKPIFYLS
jgi:hypothetical protein